jgi:hypothetical protein
LPDAFFASDLHGCDLLLQRKTFAGAGSIEPYECLMAWSIREAAAGRQSFRTLKKLDRGEFRFWEDSIPKSGAVIVIWLVISLVTTRNQRLYPERAMAHGLGKDERISLFLPNGGASDANVPAGHSLRLQNAVEESGLYDCCRRHA